MTSHIETRTASRAPDPFSRLLNSFCTRLSPSGLKVLHAFCDDVGLFSYQQVKGFQTSYLLRELNNFGLINEDNVQLFKYVARASEQDEILEIVNQFETGRCEQVKMSASDYDCSEHTVPGYTAVDIHVLDRVEEMDRQRIESICMSTADVSGIAYHELAWIGYRADTNDRAMIMALLPKKCLSALRSRLDDMEDRTLEEIRVVDVDMKLKYDLPMRPRSDAVDVGGSPQVRALIKSVCEGVVPSVNEIKDATGPTMAEHVLNSLLEQAVQHNNAGAVDKLVHLASCSTGKTQDSIVDIIQERNIQISLKLLPNAYIVGLEKLVRSLVSHGFILHPTVMSYTVLLTTVCQKRDYPQSLLRFLLNSEKSIMRPFQDCSKEEVYERCLKYCCMNDRDDLVELFLKRGANMSTNTLHRYSSCIGRAMSHIGCHFRAIRTPQGLVRCVDVSWQDRGLTQINTAWLSKQNLHAFLTRLDVSNNHLLSIPHSLFDGTLRCLEDLDCSGNKLKFIWANDMDPLPRHKSKLRFFSVSRNELEELPLLLFQIASLEILDVSRNCLTSLPGPDPLEATSSESSSSDPMERCNWWLCTWLKELDVSHNCLTQLPETFGDVLHLHRLNVSNNKISILAKSLSKARFLDEVNLSGNCLGLAVINSNLEHLPKSIQKLNVSSNNFGFVPRSLLSITSLRRLDCARNSIGHLPYKQEWNLPHLESLYLNENNLGGTEGNLELPDSFAKSLTFLNLSHNQLKKFPPSILQLKLAACIILEGNPEISKLPTGIAALKRLWELRIDDMKKAVQEYNPKFYHDSPRVHYSRVKHIFRDSYYRYSLYVGVKLAVSGSEKARECVIRELQAHSGITDSPEELPMVSSLLFTTGSPLLVKRRPKRGSRTSKTDSTVATFKVWNISDNASFVVLQQVFFAENTVHLLVWDESDQTGLDEIEDTFQLIRGRANSVQTLLVTLTSSKRPSPEVQERLDVLAKKTGHNAVNLDMNRRRQTSRSLLYDHIFSIAETLAKASETVKGEPNNKVPSSFSLAASKFFGSESDVSKVVVCTRKFIDKEILLDDLSDPDDFEQAMRFFVRIGALLHFEDTPRNLHEYFYLNMNVVSLILVALASGGCTFLSSGVIHVRHIYSLFKKLSVSDADGNALFALLIKLSVLVPLDCRRCLLPFRLPSEKPGLNLALSQYLSPCEDTTNTGTSGPTYVRRLYSAPCLPSCFWGRFISALVLQIQGVLDSLETVGKHRAKTNAIFWAGGIVALYDEGCLVVNAVMNNDWNEDVKPMESSRVCVKNGLDIVVFDRRRQFAALGLVCSHIEALFQEWIDQNGPYGDHTSSRSEFLAESTVERLIPYPAFAFSLGQSEDEALNSFIFEHAIPEKATLLKVEDCAQAIINYSKMMDPTGSGGFIDVSHVAPDLILASLPPSERFQEDDVQIEITSSSNLGRGSFANVYLGYLGDTKVAFKVFASNLLPPTVDCVHFELKEDHFSLRKKSSRRAHGQIFSRRNCKAMKKVATLKQLKLLASVGTIGEARVSDDEVKSASPPIAPQFDSSQCFKHMQDLLQEATVMKQLRHPNIVQFKGVLFEPYPCLVMEFAPGGNLATLIKTRREEIGTVSGLMGGVHFSGAAHDGIMGRELTHRIAFQVALGIEYLHSKAICHLDMKPENVLVWSESLTAPVNVKLTDYGISCTVTAVGLSSTRGTLGYQAPEQVIMRNNISKSFDLRVDVFAYGMMMYYLLMGVHPYESDMDKLTVVEQKIRQNDRPPLPTGQSLVHLQSVIDRCWQYWPSERPSASQIVAEICEPSFHLQCMDLLVNGSHEVLATALMMDQSGTVCFDSVDSETIGTCVESRRRAYTWGLPSTARIPLKQKKVLKKRPTSLFQTSPPKSPERARSPSPDRAILPRSFSNEMLTHYEEAVDKFHLRSPTPSVLPPSIEEERNTNHIKTEMKSKYPEDSLEASCEDSYSSESSSEDEETIKKPPSFALLITADSLLVANPPVSCFLCKQDTKKIISSVVSAVLYLNSWLWVGLHSKELQVFQCVGGEISRRIKQLSFSCNAVIEDIQCQFFKAQTQVKIFALLANGQIIVIHGHQYKNKADSPRLLNEWGRDLLYCWDHPEIRSVGKIGLEEEEAVSVASCMVLVQPGELWYCQGNSIVAVNTAKSPEEVIRVHGSITDSVTVPDIRMIKEAVVVGDSVWCSDRIESDELCEIDISSRSPKKTWRLKELYSDRDKWSHMVTVEGSSTNRKCHWQNVPSMNSLSVQCLAAVCDTLWVGCNNGAILIMHKDSAERIQLLATLWCRPAVDYFTGQKQGSLPSVVMSRIRQVGDRVLVYHKTHPRNDQKAGQTVVTEVFQAVDSSQLCTLGSYYSIHNA